VGDVAGDLLGVVGAVQLGAEHHLEKGPVGDGEADVGDADLQEAAGGLVGLAEGGGQAPEPVGGDRGQQAGLVAEVVGGGGSPPGSGCSWAPSPSPSCTTSTTCCGWLPATPAG
jgi:hypothetical protein